jgi:hypothetical protein
MSDKHGEPRREWYEKKWNPLFSTERDPPKEDIFVESRRSPDIGALGSAISIFLRDFEDSVGHCMVPELEEFLRDACEDDLKRGLGAAGLQRTAWLDDRTYSHGTVGGCVREYENPLTATALYKLLKRSVSGQRPSSLHRKIVKLIQDSPEISQ